MKKKFLSVMSGALMCLSLVLSSCGNIDNPLEEIGKSNPTVAALAGALDEGAEVTVYFTLVGGLPIESSSEPRDVEMVFKKKNGVFELKSMVGFGSESGSPSSDQFENFKEYFKLSCADNQLKVSLEYPVNNLVATTRAISIPLNDVTVPLNTIVFDLNNNMYTQYVYPYIGCILYKGISINGEDKSSLIKTDYEEEANFYFNFLYAMILGQDLPVVETRGEVDMSNFLINCLRVFYKDGETWADVNKRYKDIAGKALLDEPDEEGLAILMGSADGDGVNFYYLEETGEPTPVKYAEKVGYKDGKAHSTGYLFINRAEPTNDKIIRLPIKVD